MIRHNIGYKLMALVIAFVIWIYVNEFQTNSEGQNHKSSYVSSSFVVPLKAKNVGAGYTVVKMPGRVSVVVEGRQEDVAAIAAEQDLITAYVNLRGYSAGSHTIPVITKFPDDIADLRKRAEPHSAVVVLEERVRRQMAIEAEFIGLTPESDRLLAPVISPASATVFGTARNVEIIRHLVVEVNSTTLAEKNIDHLLPIVALDANGKPIKGLEIAPKSAHLRLGQSAGSSKRSLSVTPNIVGQLPLAYKVSSVEIEPQVVIAAGNQSDLVGVSTLQTQPIQLSGRKQTFTQQVKIVTPPGITLPKGGHVKVTVNIVASHALSAPETQSPDSKP